jgi:hypothetical protein
MQRFHGWMQVEDEPGTRCYGEIRLDVEKLMIREDVGWRSEDTNIRSYNGRLLTCEGNRLEINAERTISIDGGPVVRVLIAQVDDSGIATFTSLGEPIVAADLPRLESAGTPGTPPSRQPPP